MHIGANLEPRNASICIIPSNTRLEVCGQRRMIRVIAVPHSNMKQKLVAEPDATNAPFIRTNLSMAFVAYF